MLTDGSAIMGELSQGQMSDLSQASANENVQYEFAFADRAALLMHLQGVHALEVNSR